MPASSSPGGRQPPLVLHVLYRFATGGLENGVVNLINHMPPGDFRHGVLAIDHIDPAFAARLKRPDVALHALHKAPGHAYGLYPRIWRLMRELRPAIVHTRNLAALELQLPALAAGVRVRVHGEHGRDIEDLDGTDRRLQRVRRLYSPLVHRYVAVSRDLQGYLVDRVGIRASRVEQIYNGVDTERFAPAPGGPVAIGGSPFDPQRHWVVGTVGRLQTVKNPSLLLEAFLRALALHPPMRGDARLAIVGGGTLLSALSARVDAADARTLVWLPGERADVADVLRGLHVYALPSLAEGVSNTILEAMASALPVLATDVGGNRELVLPERTGRLVPSNDVDSLAQALVALYRDRAMGTEWGRQARLQAESRFSLQAMVRRYLRVYEDGLARRG